MAEDDLLIGSDFAFLRREGAAKSGRNMQQLEPRGCDQHAANLLRRTVQLHCLIARTEDGLALKNGHFSKAVEVVTGATVVGPDYTGFGVFVGRDQDGIRVRYRQRAQDDGVYDGEESSVGGDADGKSEKHGKGKALLAP